MNFNEKYQPLFHRVCIFLGNGWRIDKRGSADSYRINLMNPVLKNYSITVRQEKDRLILVGGCRRSNRFSEYSKCTVSPSREPWGIAEDIKRKILIDADKQIANVAADFAEVKRLKDEERIVVNLISRLVSTQPYEGYYGIMCSFRTQGMSGDVAEWHNGTYRVKLHDLSKDQLIKLVGFMSTLER